MYLAGGALAFLLVVYVGAFRSRTPTASPAPAPRHETALDFTDSRRQAAEFIEHERSITLTPEQQQRMDAALSSIPAPCCDAYSIATCCCPCNLARATWGLAKLLIAQRDATVAEVHDAASRWLRFTNPDGYTGDACFTDGCSRSFERNGCGGMDGAHIH